MCIDLAVTMPTQIFQEKDYLNYRYFHKRAFYLACIATGILEAEDSSFTIEYALQNDNQLQPIIIVHPGEGSDDFSKSRCTIQVILAADGNLFPISKTLPHKNAVRPTIGVNSHGSLPTPFYNASIRSECSSLAYLKYLHVNLVQTRDFANACILGSVWLRQRGLWDGGFGPFEWACTVALLMQAGGLKGNPILSKGYNSYQIFKATLQYLAATDLVTNPLLIQPNGFESIRTNRPMLFDGVRGHNILYKMTPWSYAMLRHEANLTMKSLSDPLSDRFDACFITKVEGSLSRLDYTFSLPLCQQYSPARDDTDAVPERLVYCQEIYQTLSRGLDDRVLLIHIEAISGITWPPTSRKPVERSESYVKIGLLVSPAQVNRAVDHGPLAEDREAAIAYRKFWGEKAELRRFRDGSIQESLVWSVADPRNCVLKQVIAYILQRHIGHQAIEGLKFVGESIDYMMPTYKGTLWDSATLYQPIMKAFKMLEKDIRSLEGLPLHIRQISAADPQLRYASIKAPILNSIQCMIDPANVCVQFEGSSRWPDDLSAVRRTKMAFLLKIGELLEGSVTGLTAQVGLENAQDHLVNIVFLDINYPSGAFFRLRIHHERELNLLERSVKGKSHTTASREQVASALALYKRNFIQSPTHTQVISTLGTRFPLLSPSMRLMKRWRDFHLLSDHVGDELIELLTVRTFVHPYPWSVPGSVLTGFLRTLALIAKWDWPSEPLIVDMNGEMDASDVNTISLRFEAWRNIDPAMNRVAMFAASNVDRDGITWTEPGPSKLVAARFSSLAKAACKLIKERGIELEPEALFAASMGDYDFSINLKPQYTPNEKEMGIKTQPVFKNLHLGASEKRSLIGFKPIHSYLDELRMLYESNVLFFYNASGGSVIAGLWNPQTALRPWKVNLQYSTMPLSPSHDRKGKPQVVINQNAILHDISRLGADMILRIEVRK